MDHENSSTFYSLSPRADLRNDPTYKLYQERLNKVLDGTNRNIQNVALIGERGTGKSSILQTFNQERLAAARKQGKDSFKGMLFVSLIDFEERKSTPKQTAGTGSQTQSQTQNQTTQTDGAQTETEPEKTEPDQAETQKRLECSILKQILVRCSDDDLKNSRLRSIIPAEPRKMSLRKFLGISLYLIISGLIFGLIFEERFGLLLRYLKMPDLWRVFCHALGYAVLFVAAFGLGVYWWWTRSSPIRLSKLTFKHSNAEAEFTTMDQKYCLDEYKFEIIHILNKLAPRIGHVVIFEDMERLDNSLYLEIMTKLRELNQLVNTYRAEHNPNAEPIRFIYALNDRKFTYENRIKFFDLVLPLVPKLNHASFSSRFCTELENITKVNPGSEIRKMIQGLKGDLFDYRLVLSIINEYQLFRALYIDHQAQRNNAYQLDGRTDACILAIAIYKTLCPARAVGLFGSGTRTHFEAPDPQTEPMQYQVYQYLADGGYLSEEKLRWILYPYVEVACDWEKQLQTGSWEDRIEAARAMCEDDTVIFSQDKHFRDIFENAADPDLARYLGRVVFQDDLNALIERIKEINDTGTWTQTLFTSYLAALYNFYDSIPDYLPQEHQELLANWCSKQLEHGFAAAPADPELAKDWDSRWFDGLALMAAACLSAKPSAEQIPPASTPAASTTSHKNNKNNKKNKKNNNSNHKNQNGCPPKVPRPQNSPLDQISLGGKPLKEWRGIFEQSRS